MKTKPKKLRLTKETTKNLTVRTGIATGQPNPTRSCFHFCG